MNRESWRMPSDLAAGFGTEFEELAISGKVRVEKILSLYGW